MTDSDNNLLAYGDSGNRSVFGTGALRDRPPGKGMFQLIPPEALMRWALRCEVGHLKYGDGRNWEKGMPIAEFLDSALRHLVQYAMGDKSEDHLAAALWNIGCIIWTEKHHPEMQNLPSRKED